MACSLIQKVHNAAEDIFGERNYALVVAGSYARDEQTRLLEGGREVLAGDLEFTLFLSNLSWLKGSLRKAFVSRILGISSADGVPIDFDLKPAFLMSFIPPSLFWYETITANRVYGGLRWRMPDPIAEAAVDRGDLIEVLNHSAIAIIKKLISVEPVCPIAVAQIKYQIAKAYLDLFIPLLAADDKVLAFHEPRFNFVIENGLLGDLEIRHGGLIALIRRLKIERSPTDIGVFDDFDVDELLRYYQELNRKCREKLESNGFNIGVKFQGSNVLPRRLFRLVSSLRRLYRLSFFDTPLSVGELIDYNYGSIEMLIDSFGKVAGTQKYIFRKRLSERLDFNCAVYKYLR